MSTSKEEIIELIEANSDFVDFGSSEDAESQEWFEKAEAVLGVKLPPSYVWFLENYAGGEINGEEIYSLYGMDFEEAVGGDIVYVYLTNQRNGTLDGSKIAVCETDFGEVFYFDKTKTDEGGELPVYLRLPSGEAQLYGKTFLDFLKKRIEVHAG